MLRIIRMRLAPNVVVTIDSVVVVDVLLLLLLLPRKIVVQVGVVHLRQL